MFQNKVVLITGAGAGIGAALAQILGQQGAIVIPTDINWPACQQVAEQIRQAGGQAYPDKLDVSQPLEFQQLIDKVVAQHQRLDYIFNNAGIGLAAEVQDMEISHWQKIVEINLMGVVYGSTLAYKVMTKQGFGHIVNIASLAGLIGAPTMTAYAMTKSAIITLSNSLRVEAQNFGVKVSVVCPGFIQTNIFNAAINIGISTDDLISLVPFKMLDVQKSAQLILKNVAKNSRVIVFPFYGKLIWGLSRLSLTLLETIHKKTVQDFRRKKSR